MVLVMRKIETAENILELAIEREEEACRFYLTLAERVETLDMRNILEELAAEELEHKAKLELEFLKKGKTLFSKNRTIDIKTSDYMVSNKAIDKPIIDMNYKDMLSLAIEKEDAAFRIYVNLLGYVDDCEAKEVLLAIAEEEVKHKVRFEIEYDNLLKE